ncbi:MAG: PAS domain-containing protein [Bacteroidota bacterium]
MAHSLLCWDIIMNGIGRRKEFARDIINLQNIAVHNNWNLQIAPSVDNAIIWENKTILITDTDVQIVLATKNIYEMNGYQPEEVIGKYPKIFQGEATSADTVKQIRTAIGIRQSFECDFVNYRKNGTLYTCHIEGYPIFDKRGSLVNFIAFENIQNDY